MGRALSAVGASLALGCCQLAAVTCIARFQDFSAGGAFGIFQGSVLFDDQCTAQRDHHENAQAGSQGGHDHDTPQFKLEAQQHDGRHRDADPKGDGFTGRAAGLDDVVFQNGGIAEADLGEKLKNRDGNDGNRDRGTNRQAYLEDQIKGGCAKNHTQ